MSTPLPPQSCVLSAPRMPARRTSCVGWRLASVLIALGLVAAPAAAQRQEFVTQTILVTRFRGIGDRRAAPRVSDELRSRVYKLTVHRDVEVVDAGSMDEAVELSGFSPDSLAEGDVRTLAQKMRADEVVLGSVWGRPGLLVVNATLVITRDWRVRQPLPEVRAKTPAEAGELMAREVVRARAQFTGLRRCENALRGGDDLTAAREAEQAIRAYPPSSMARTCLMGALVSAGVRADSVRKIAEEIIALDSLNLKAAVIRAKAYDAEGRAADAIAAWTYVVRIRPDSLALGVMAVEDLLRLERPAAALSMVRRLYAANAEHTPLRRLAFRAHVGLSQWHEAAALGDSLERDDEFFRADSNYAFRFVTALRRVGDPVAAMAASARAVKRYADDARIYGQYVELLLAEQNVALARGLAHFPAAPGLHVLAATSARGAGKRKDAIGATNQALKLDPAFAQGYLQLADLWFDEQQPDSALGALQRIPRDSPQAEILRTYAIARGGQLLRAAADTAPARQRLAISFLALADSVESREDTRGYLARATLQLARVELVRASTSRGCSEAKLADEALTTSEHVLERGAADEGAGQLREAFGAMKAAVDNALKVLCKS